MNEYNEEQLLVAEQHELEQQQMDFEQAAALAGAGGGATYVDANGETIQVIEAFDQVNIPIIILLLIYW